METSFSYNVMSYPSKFFLQTHPDHLASIATWFGMEPPPIEKCRFLELGCGNGSNLISHAFNLPDAEFVGVDLSEKHILHAKESAQELNLLNLKFHQLDVMKMTVGEFGKFDYIIAHGLFSWIPSFVREKVLSLYREMLTPNGIGYISYNAFPGAHLRDMVRNMMRFHTQNISEPMEKVGNAVSFLSFLAENTSATKTYQPVLQEELIRHSKHDATAIFHDDLADIYQPFYFHEFASELGKNGLQFLSEAELHAMSTHNFAPEVRTFLESFDDPVQREQYLDFLCGRVFRQTLVCHRETVLNRQIEPSILNKFLLSSPIRPQSDNPELAANKVEKFVGTTGTGFEIDHPLTKAALLHLGKIWGKAISFPELLQAAKQMLEEQGFTDENWETRFNEASAIFFQICFNTSIIELHLHHPQSNVEISDMPEVNRLSRWQLRYSDLVTTLFNKYMKIDDPVSRRLLELLDGTRNRTELLAHISEFIETNVEEENKQEMLDNLSNWLDESLFKLARTGMFVS